MSRSENAPGHAPLAGSTVCLTRPRGSSESLRQLAVTAGADVLDMPLIEIVPTAPGPLVDGLNRLLDYDGVIVTSANAATIALDCATTAGIPLSKGTPWYTIGRATANAAATASLRAVEFASETGEAFAQQLVRQYGDGRRRLLFLRGKKARSVIPNALRNAGHDVDEVVCYDTLPAVVQDDVWTKLRGVQSAFMPLFSPSAAQSLAAQLASAAEVTFLVVAIGQTTASACQACGVEVAAMAPMPTADSMLSMMMQLWQNSADVRRRR